MTDVAIIGAGFSGTLQAVHLLRAGSARVTLIEREHAFARGIAYSTTFRGHLLNVRSSNMSALADEPDHFVRWLERTGRDAPGGFATRHDYGDYLQHILSDAERDHPGRLERRSEAAIEIGPEHGRFHVALAGGARLVADTVVLALGNLPPLDPPGIIPSALPENVYVPNPWREDFARDLAPDDVVMIVGTGLTMIDVALRLSGSGFAGEIVALSRRGLVPRAHGREETAPLAPGAIPDRPTPLTLLRHVRRRAEELGWRTAVDELRPLTEALWRDASHAEQRRFLRHLRPWWDVHRHRLAPPIADEIGAMVRSGRLRIESGRLRGLRADGGHVEARWAERTTGALRSARVRRIINCTGPQGNLMRTRESLLRLLLAGGHIRPDPLGIGIDVDDQARAFDVRGEPNDNLRVVGPMSQGAFWEIVAVPDVRVQVQAVARSISEGANPYPSAPRIGVMS